MVSSTISLTPAPASSRRVQRRERASAVSAACKLSRKVPPRSLPINPPKHQSASVTVGRCPPRPMRPVRFRAGALRPDCQATDGIQMRDRATAGADLDHLDHRYAQGRPLPLRSGAFARPQNPGTLWLAVVDEADLGGRPRHRAPTSCLCQVPARRPPRRSHRRPTRFDQTHRKARAQSPRCEPARRQHQEERTAEAQLNKLGVSRRRYEATIGWT